MRPDEAHLRHANCIERCSLFKERNDLMAATRYAVMMLRFRVHRILYPTLVTIAKRPFDQGRATTRQFAGRGKGEFPDICARAAPEATTKRAATSGARFKSSCRSCLPVRTTPCDQIAKAGAAREDIVILVTLQDDVLELPAAHDADDAVVAIPHAPDRATQIALGCVGDDTFELLPAIGIAVVVVNRDASLPGRTLSAGDVSGVPRDVPNVLAFPVAGVTVETKVASKSPRRL